jgi:protein-serine/threonine kinase
MGNCCEKKKKINNDETFKLLEDLLDVKDDNSLGIKITIKDFQKIKLLGKGSFGEVFLVKYIKTNKIYAMKILDKNKVIEGGQVEHTKIERDLLVNINCPFIVEIKFAFQDKENLYIITEFLQGGELFFHLHKEKRFTNDKAKFYVAEIVAAIEYLHKKKIVYRDLKPENVLISDTGHVKLTDFGLSKIFKKSKEKAYTICGTPQYLAPEVIISEDGYDSTVDWWSLGCVLYELLIGRAPFRICLGDSLNEDLYKKKILIPDYVCEDAKDLITKLLVVEPKKRLGYGENGAKKIKHHPFFKGINWDDVWNQRINPPFIPNLKDETDLSYFDTVFTNEQVSGSNSDLSGLSLDCNTFKGFTYVTDSYGSELMIMSKPCDNDDLDNNT